MRILVTGGAGFIGSNFIHYWMKHHPSDAIINLDKLTYAGNLDNLKDIENNPNYKFVKGDIADPKIVNEVMPEIDVVVNFAAESHVDRSITGPAGFIKTNVVGTQVLLDAAVANKIKKFHHISTDEVFGHIPLDKHYKFTENTLYEPRSPYSASKAASDHLVRAYYSTYNLPITITNCSNNFGPYQHPEKFIPRAITNILQGEKIPVYTPGNQVRDWLYVEDHCLAIDLVLSKGKIGQTYLVGGMTGETSNKQVAEKILEMMSAQKSQTELVPDRPGHDVKYMVDWNKIKNELGWQPLYSFDDWLKKTIEWYRSNEKWWKDLKVESEKFYANNRI